MKNAQALSISIDFSGKHTTYRMTNRNMQKTIRADKINKREVYDLDFFTTYFVKEAIQKRLEFLLKHANSFEDVIKKAALLDLTIQTKIKKVDFTLSVAGQKMTISSDNLSKQFDYDVSYFEDYFSKTELSSERLKTPEALETAFREFEANMDTSIPSEEIVARYTEEKIQADAQDVFEVELEDWQIEREVNGGIYIKVWFGLDSEGLVFIPDSHLEIDTTPDLDKQYRIFLEEKKYYYLYNKDNSDANRFVMGKTMIKQLSGERQTVPHRKIITENTIKEKMKEINLLLNLKVKERSYSDIKEELIEKIAQKELKMNELRQKMATLNQVEELLVGCDSDNPDVQRRSRLELSKLNVSVHLTYAKVSEQLRELQDDLYQAVGDYEVVIRQMETYIDLLKRYNSEKDKGQGMEL